MAYNPYAAVQKIYNAKKGYNQAKNSGGNYNAYASEAQAYYKELEDNGMSAIAKELQESDETATQEIVKRIAKEYGTGTAPANSTAKASTAVNTPSVSAGTVSTPQNTFKASNTFQQSSYENIDPQILENIKTIVLAKGQYDKSKYNEGTQEYQNIQKAAQEFYNSLISSGRSDIANDLSGADTAAAIEYLNKLLYPEDTANNESTTVLNTFNDMVGQGSNTNQSGSLLGSGTSFINNGSGSAINFDDFLSNSGELLNTFNSYLQPSETTTAANNQTMSNLQAIFDTFGKNNDLITSLIGDTSGLIKDAYGNIGSQTDDIYKYIGTNPYEGDIANSIMSHYNQLGGYAAANQSAQGAGNNSGNIDSYAAANAKRQQLDFTNAGNNAILNQYNSTVANMLNTLNAYGVNVGDLIEQQNNLVGNTQNYNLGVLGGYNEGTRDFNNTLQQAQQGNADALANVIGTLAGLYETQSGNATMDYSTGANAFADMFNTAKSGETTDYANQLSSLSNMYSTSRGAEANEAMTKMNNDTDITTTRMTLDSAMAQLDKELAASDKMNMDTLRAELEKAGISADVDYATLSNAYRMASAENASNERMNQADNSTEAAKVAFYYAELERNSQLAEEELALKWHDTLNAPQTENAEEYIIPDEYKDNPHKFLKLAFDALMAEDNETADTAAAIMAAAYPEYKEYINAYKNSKSGTKGTSSGYTSGLSPTT